VTKTPLSWNPQPYIVGTSGLCVRSYICVALMPWLRLRHATAPAGTGNDVSGPNSRNALGGRGWITRGWWPTPFQFVLTEIPPSFAAQSAGRAPAAAPGSAAKIAWW
jgi:hypothetical protein